ncbi:LuxR C-terminal-related transcriptional regulator [Sinomonas gamaensis]|uniref:LuxR C-terminal-related transcriptional regulator n=1 Tax=Sinomonas gamaensis TaxID=2565624 RepID=UPI0020167988|nr:LuxR C-terminal-related transcriptional regulator [Sinomonas gamaensis]
MVDRVLRHVAQGRGVRIVGSRGSGRTSVVKQLVEHLEEQGTRVYSIFAIPSLAAVPFSGILSMGLDIRTRTVGIMGISDLLAEQLSRSGTRLLVVDDIDNLDRDSLAVIDVVQKRTEVPLIVTASDVPFESKAPAVALGRWPEVTVAIPPLRYEQVNALIMERLGAPADVTVSARILAKSGGNLRLAVRIIETAKLSERLVLREGRWALSGNTLMNEHLHATIEGMLHGLGSEEFKALAVLSLHGPSPVERLVDTIGTDVLDRLEHRGLVSAVAGPEGELLASVFPPVVEDYLTGHVLKSRKILRSALSESFMSPSYEVVDASEAEDPVRAALGALRSELAGSHAATVRHFHKRLEFFERVHYRAWETDPSLSNAVAFLRVYWGAPIDENRVCEVFSGTDTRRGDPGDRLFFTITKAMWLTNDGDADAAYALLEDFASKEPAWEAEARAFAVLIESNLNGVPADVDEFFAKLTSRQPTSGLSAIVKGLIELYRFNPDAAVAAVDAAAGFDTLPRFEPFIRGMALFAAGKFDEALVYSLERRQVALQTVDQFSLVTQSYVAALALLYRGLFDEAEYLMGWAFALGRPGFLLSSLYNAMLRLSSLRDEEVSSALGEQAGPGARDVGPLPGVGKGVYELVLRKPPTSEAFDVRASRLLDDQLAHGFVFEAVFTGVFALCLLPGPRMRERVEALLHERGVAQHDQLLAVAGAALEGDLRLVSRLLEAYVPDGDAYQIVMLLHGAARRFRLAEGSSSQATGLDRLAERFAARFKTEGQFIAFEPGLPNAILTDREREIALLAGIQTNQEIASQLGLSVRTVESHISNALRKTNAVTRKALFELVRNWVR